MQRCCRARTDLLYQARRPQCWSCPGERAHAGATGRHDCSTGRTWRRKPSPAQPSPELRGKPLSESQWRFTDHDAANACRRPSRGAYRCLPKSKQQVTSCLVHLFCLTALHAALQTQLHRGGRHYARQGTGLTDSQRAVIAGGRACKACSGAQERCGLSQLPHTRHRPPLLYHRVSCRPCQQARRGSATSTDSHTCQPHSSAVTLIHVLSLARGATDHSAHHRTCWRQHQADDSRSKLGGSVFQTSSACKA